MWNNDDGVRRGRRPNPSPMVAQIMDRDFDPTKISWRWLQDLGGEVGGVEGFRYVEFVVGEDDDDGGARLRIFQPNGSGVSDVNVLEYDKAAGYTDQVWLSGRKYAHRGEIRRLIDLLGAITEEK